MAKNLLIVESPAKAKTIEKILGKDFKVTSSYGHVRDLAKKDMGIQLDADYEPNYEVPTDKKKVVAELKKLAKNAEVWLATDEDREGEAISWHLAEVLGLDMATTKRIVFNEITATAIKAAIADPRTVDQNVVHAQQARRILDRLVGFELSPLLWRKISSGRGLSAGRVQSVAVRILVEREREVINFDAVPFYRVSAQFIAENGELKGELNKRFDSQEECQKFLEDCASAGFTVGDIEVKPSKRNPAAPFTTSTLQQEASRKLGFSVSRTMSVAQRLYEGGFITYMRTDSVNLSNLAINTAKDVIIEKFGKEFSQVRKHTNKKGGAAAQEAHEAIRPTYIQNEGQGNSDEEKRLYDLIWKRTVASQMAPAELERTTVKIDVSNRDEQFNAKGEVIKFAGFLTLYTVSKDDEDNGEEDAEGLLPRVTVGENLTTEKIVGNQKFTNPPYRFTEASLVKKLEEMGIGRPSTYAPTINTIQKRNYVVKESRDGKKRAITTLALENGNVTATEGEENYGAERNKLFPTDLGIVVTDFLSEHFERIMDYDFTAKIEEQFDAIAHGKVEWVDFVDGIYKPFHKQVEHTQENAERVTGERVLGVDPESGRQVAARLGKFGPMVQIGTVDEEEKPRFAKLLPTQDIASITYEDAMDLFKLPRVLGKNEEGVEIKANIGRYGPYVQLNRTFVSIPEEFTVHTITLEKATELIKEKLEADANRVIHDFADAEIQVLKGRYGPYIKQGRNNFRIPKDVEPESLTQEKCEEIIANAPPKRGRRKKK